MVTSLSAVKDLLCMRRLTLWKSNSPLNVRKDRFAMGLNNRTSTLGNAASPDVTFLAGDGSSYVTGTTIFADGGLMQSSPGL